MSERIDISGPVWDICDRLGLVYENVAQVNITPGFVSATVYKLNEQGAKYVDLEINEPAQEEHLFEVTT